jgi:hypothetical protein
VDMYRTVPVPKWIRRKWLDRLEAEKFRSRIKVCESRKVKD